MLTIPVINFIVGIDIFFSFLKLLKSSAEQLRSNCQEPIVNRSNSQPHKEEVIRKEKRGILMLLDGIDLWIKMSKGNFLKKTHFY